MKRKRSISLNSVKPEPHWLTVKNNADAHEVIISGQIGKSWYDDSGVSSKEFRDEFSKIPDGRKINVRINSEGGSIQDGLEIFNTIKGRRNDVTCCVDGYALSIASVIPLAASKVISPKSSMWMIHEPWSVTQGDASDHIKSAEMLDKHGDMLASIYAEETGHSKKEMREMMKKESWFSGDEAVDFGLADESPEEEPESASDKYNRLKSMMADKAIFNSMPRGFKKRILAGLKSLSSPLQGEELNQQQNERDKQMRKKLIALLNKRGIEFSEESTDEQLLELVENSVKPAATDNSEVEKLRKQFHASESRRIRAAVLQAGENKIANDQIETYVQMAMENEDRTIKLIESMKESAPGGDPAGPNVGSIFESGFAPQDKLKEEAYDLIAKASGSKPKTAKERYAAARADWSGIYSEAVKRDVRKGLTPQAANTVSSTITTSFLMDGSLTPLQNRWAMLRAFTRDFTTDPYKPKATGVLKNPTAGSATGTDLTTYNTGNSTVNPISVTMHQYTQPFQVSQTDLNNGLRMEDLVRINTANFANKVIEIATGPMTVANFEVTGAQPSVVSSAAAFSFNELAQLQGQLQKSDIQNLILDGTYIARIANTPGFFQAAGVVGGNTGAWQAFGWELIARNSDWTGADPNVKGFACNPQAIVAIAGLPLSPIGGVPGGIFNVNTFMVPEVDINVAFYTWFDVNARTLWNSYDVMLGVALGDATAGVIVRSA